jgi:hypothetical protein
VDTNTYNEMKDIEERGKKAIQDGRLVEAFLVCTLVPTLQQTFMALCLLCSFAAHTTACESSRLP